MKNKVSVEESKDSVISENDSEMAEIDTEAREKVVSEADSEFAKTEDVEQDAWDVATSIYGKNEEIKSEDKKADEGKKKRFPFF